MRTPQLVLSLIWGASFMFIKVMLEETGPVAVGWLRMGMAGSPSSGCTMDGRRTW